MASVFTVFSLRGPDKARAQNMIFINSESDFAGSKMQKMGVQVYVFYYRVL